MSERDWESIEASQIMRPNVVTTSANTPLSEIVQLLSDQRISGVPVTDEAGHVVGVLSMRDVLEYYASEEIRRPSRTSTFYMTTNTEDEVDDNFELPETAEGVAGDVMTAEVFSVAATDSVMTVAKAFVEHGIHRVLVHDKGKFVGLIGTLDVLGAIT